MSSTAIEVRDLRMRDGTVDAVRGIDVGVGSGEAFRFVGPATTTTIETLEGYRPRISGDVSVPNVDPAFATRQRRDRFGLVVPSGASDALLTAHEWVTSGVGT